MAPNLQTSFWERMDLDENCHEKCLNAIQELYSGCKVKELEGQGYCSFTLLVSPQRDWEWNESESLGDASPTSQEDFIVQIRPWQHSLDLDATHAAKLTYGCLAPTIRKLNCSLPGRLEAFEMERMQGVPFKQVQCRKKTLDDESWKMQCTMIRSFANFVSKGWISSTHISDLPSRRLRADSPITDTSSSSTPLFLSQCPGKVGSQILCKLSRLAQELPDLHLRNRAAETLSSLKEMQDWPVVLNHGDLVPSNILIDPSTREISGVVDWAEAEFLPFGTCLYGLEHFLGYLDTFTPHSPRYYYHDKAAELRRAFWNCLWEEAPQLREKGTMKNLEVVRDVGVFLWYGYAWDEGRIDRVVNARDDVVEVCMLRAFLGGRS